MAFEFQFGRFFILPESRLLLRDGAPTRLGARAFDTLVALIERRDRIVAKAELLESVWRGLTVEEGNLQVQINTLRKLIGAESIATIPGVGYRFVAAVSLARVVPPRVNPPAESPLFGRDADLAAVADMIRRHRLVTIVGTGGVGKTRLAQAVAQAMRADWRDGVWTMEFAGLTRPEFVAPTVARVLGLALGPRPQALTSLAEALRGRRLMLLLDNCEHVVEAVAHMAKAIHAEAEGVGILATSQGPLRLDQEQVYRLGSLATPTADDLAAAEESAAVTLFVARVRAADAAFALNERNVAAVVDICRRLDGVPLAIEFAAARVSLLGVEGVRRRLGERLRLLAGGQRHALPRHQTLRAALEWSYQLLDERERRALDRLGIFVGGFSPDSALKLLASAGDEYTALEDLGGLSEKSLVVTAPGEPPRHRLLESTRAFALERLAAMGELAGARRDHARALIESFRETDPLESTSARLVRTAPDLDKRMATSPSVAFSVRRPSTTARSPSRWRQ